MDDLIGAEYTVQIKAAIPQFRSFTVQKKSDLLVLEKQPMQWDDVRYFLVLAQVGSLSGAARTLGVEHSTVARRVEALEQALGIRLFDRLPRGWSLTAEGETLLDQARRLDQEVQAFSRAALGVSSLQGTVRVSAPPALVAEFLVPRLAARQAEWKRIQLDVTGESREANLARGEADLAIRMSRPTAPGLAARCIGEIGFGLYARHGYADRAEDQWEFLGYDDSLVQVEQQQWLQKFAGKRPFVFRSNNLSALHSAARAGLGVAVLPHFLAKQDAALSPVTAAACPVTRKLWLVMHPDVKRSPRVRLIADLLIDVLADAESILSGKAEK